MGYKRSILIGGSLVLIVLLVSGLTFYMSLGSCPNGTLECDNGTLCVPKRQICDKRQDCIDGKDESPYECGMFYGCDKLAMAIMRYYFIRLNESISHPTEEFQCDIQTYPKFCSCKQSTMIYCGNIGLQEIPQFSPEISRLLIIGNNLTLKRDALQGYNLILLDLNQNNISHIPDGFFSGLYRLQRLYLGFNNIERIPLHIFVNLKSLQWLYLNSNGLRRLELKTFKYLTGLCWLNLTDNKLSLKNDIFPRMENLIDLSLDYNWIEEISEDLLVQLDNLCYLSIMHNRITYIHPKAFWNLSSLTELRLSGNPLKQMYDETFIGMSNLNTLYLADTNLTMTKDLIQNLNVSYLNLDGIDFQRIDFQAIAAISSLQYIVYNKFYYCSNTPNLKKCMPNSDGVSSFEDLLTKPVLRYSAWVIGILTFFGNALVLWGRFIYRDENRGVTMVIRNLAVSDLLMGFYLFVIGFQDTRYRNRYNEIALDWISSWNCVAVGILAVISSEVSMLILAFMSLERFLLIANPFGSRRQLNMRNIGACMLVIWIFGIIMAVAPAIIWRSSTRFYGTYSGTCFPLHIQEKYPLGWEYSAFLFLGLNMFLLILISVLYTGLMLSIWKTRRATPLAAKDEFAVRFFFIVITNVACWAPIIMVKIWAFLSYDISGDTYAWLVVFILPLNSAVNPVLYTFTTTKYRKQVFQPGWQKITSLRKRSSTSNSNPGSGTTNPDESQGKIKPQITQATISTNYKI